MKSPIKRKLFTTKASSVDEESKSVTFVISTNEPDRYGDVVDQKSWNFKSYLKNPIVLWGHNPEEPENVLGTAASLQVAPDGSQTTATLSFDEDINPKAGLVFNQIKRGTLRTVSVGFRNHTMEWEDDTPILKDNELLEISVVPIPANAGAVALSLKAGELNTKDARWMLDSMQKEAQLLEEQLKADAPKDKKKTMTDEQAQAIIDGMAKLTEKVDALTTENAELKTQIAELKPAVETDEEKAAREAKEAADAKAAKEAENVAAGLNPDGTAKGGGNDQPGASDNKFDENAELTPELQAQIDAEFEAQAAELAPAA